MEQKEIEIPVFILEQAEKSRRKKNRERIRKAKQERLKRQLRRRIVLSVLELIGLVAMATLFLTASWCIVVFLLLL